LKKYKKPKTYMGGFETRPPEMQKQTGNGNTPTIEIKMTNGAQIK
jgi:hypothetical protein